jgi:hypothetical protein
MFGGIALYRVTAEDALSAVPPGYSAAGHASVMTERYRFAPGLKVRIPHEGGGYLVRTNREGFRCDHNVTARKGRTYRVLVFGDSYTAGDGVSNGKRYSDVLEQSLDDAEVLNFGLSGSGTDQQYLVFRRYAGQLEYDAVVIGVLVENIKRNTVKFREWAGRAGESLCVPKPWFELSPDAELSLKGVPVPPPYTKEHVPSSRLSAAQWVPSARRMVNRLGPDFKDWLQRVTRIQPLPEYDSANQYSWKRMQAILAKWVSEIKVPVVVAAIPVYQYVEETASYAHVQERFDEFARDNGCAGSSRRDRPAAVPGRHQADVPLPERLPHDPSWS